VQAEEKQEKPEEKPKKEENNAENSRNGENEEVGINEEVNFLQNTGIFRREYLMAIKEQTDVQKVQTQALIDLKNLIQKVVGGKNDDNKKSE